MISVCRFSFYFFSTRKSQFFLLSLSFLNHCIFLGSKFHISTIPSKLHQKKKETNRQNMNESLVIECDGFFLTEFFFDDGHLVGGYEIGIALDAGSLLIKKK